MMNNIVFTYSLIKALYDQGQDYLDAFWPFIIAILHADNDKDINFIKTKLESDFQITIPIYIIETIITRAKRKNYITQKEHAFCLTEKGNNYSINLETTTEVQRRINALIADLRAFLSARGLNNTDRQILDDLTSFISRNREPLIKYINPSSPERFLLHNKEIDRQLIDYVNLIDKSKPEMYSIFHEMVKGSIISAVLSAKDPAEMMDLGQKRFSRTKLFLDSNVVFSLLDVHPPEISLPVKELFQLIKDNGFDLYVFDFTVNEICNLIRLYPSCSYKYPTTIKVDSIFSYLKIKGWQLTDAQEFIINIENKLIETGINIEATNIDIRSYIPANPHLLSKMPIYKGNQKITSQNHDYAAIEYIIKQRNKPIRRLEDSKAIFLTSDVGLYKFNLFEFGHSRDGTVNEVILDKMLTYMLWLKNPKIDLPLSSIISIHSKNLFIERKVWERFYDVINRLRIEKHISDDDIVSLFYHNFIENALLEIGESDVNQIDTDFTVDLIEKARLFGEKAFKDQMKAKEKEFIEELSIKTKENRILEQQYENKWYDDIKKLKDIIKKGADRSSGKYSLAFCILLSIIFLLSYIIILFYLYDSQYSKYVSVGIGSLAFLFGGGILVKIWHYTRNVVKVIFSNYIFQNKVREIEQIEGPNKSQATHPQQRIETWKNPWVLYIIIPFIVTVIAGVLSGIILNTITNNNVTISSEIPLAHPPYMEKVLNDNGINEGDSVTTSDGTANIYIDNILGTETTFSVTIGAERKVIFKAIKPGNRVSLKTKDYIYFIDIIRVRGNIVDLVVFKSKYK